MKDSMARNAYDQPIQGNASPVMKGNRNGLAGPGSASLPNIHQSAEPIQSEEEKKRLREELEQEYFKQRGEMKQVEKQTKSLTDQADELRLKLKEKETMLRIAKFKLAEVSRNIKHG